MRKIFSYFFVAIILFNVLGYYGLLKGLEYQNARKVAKRFDADLNDKESQLVTIKIPLTVPYATGSADFERVNGSFTYEGNVYRMVKQKITPEAVYVVCYRDDAGTRLSDAVSDFVKTFADGKSESKSNTKISVSFLKEYVVRDLIIEHPSSGWQREVAQETTYAVFIDSFNSSIVHPPERA